MISLLALFGGYLLAVVIGSRIRKSDGRTFAILLLSGVIQVVIVLVTMYTMAPPALHPPGR